jgi:D-apionolactonase
MNADARATPDDRFVYGRESAPAAPRPLSAGPVTALFDGADLRRAALGGAEIVRRIYTAIRDVNWDTVVPVRSGHAVEVGEREFRISYQAQYRKEELDLAAEVIIEGRADGTLRFTFQGTAQSDFPYCRIGICTLHPPAAAGRPYRAESPDGVVEGELPLLVGPQWIRDGKLHALFAPYRRLTIGMAGGLEVDFLFEGDLFEMEDQRNWTDASFKTYSTPLALGFPHQARRGQTFRQSVEVRSVSRAAAVTRGHGAHVAPVPITLAVGDDRRAGLPAIGLGVSSVSSTLSTREAELLRAVAPDHLRVDVRAGSDATDLRAALSACGLLGSRLEVALFLHEDPAAELEDLAASLHGAPVGRFLVFREGSRCSDGNLVHAARARLARSHPQARFFGGTNLYFAELNRTRPDPEDMDGLVFTVTPQVHDGDDMSVMENVQVQDDAVRSALPLAGEGREVAVSPVTLKPRFNPFANRPLAADPSHLPLPVDPRQASLFAAAWTVGSLKSLIEGGASTITYYETVGWRGLIESEAGASLPALFPSQPGMVFPVYWVFRDLNGWRSASVLACNSSDPQRVTGLALRHKGRTRVLVANLTRDRQESTLLLNMFDDEVAVSLVDRGSYDLVPSNAAAARRSMSRDSLRAGRLKLSLNPYAVACVDA